MLGWMRGLDVKTEIFGFLEMVLKHQDDCSDQT